MVLFKYASQGSALCFPVEAMVFYTLIQSAMHRQDGRLPSTQSILHYSRGIDIYGDDLIVPVEYADTVVDYLESYALKVNVNKSFKFSHFRESCGADFYKGVAVNPVYARKELHDDLRSWGASEIMSWNKTADHCYMRGYWIVAEHIRTLLRQVVKSTIPKSSKPGSGLYHFSYFLDTDLRYNRNLHTWKQKRIHFDPTKEKDQIDGNSIACLNKWGYHSYQRNRVRGILSQTKSSDRTRALPYGLARRFREDANHGLEAQRTSVLYSASVRDNSGILVSLSLPCNPEVRTVFTTGKGISGDSLSRVQIFSCCARQKSQVQSQENKTLSGGPLVYFHVPEVTDRPRMTFSEEYCLTEEVQSDPLKHLMGDTAGLDFLTSTKRDVFRSKRRWVNLA